MSRPMKLFAIALATPVTPVSGWSLSSPSVSTREDTLQSAEPPSIRARPARRTGVGFPGDVVELVLPTGCNLWEAPASQGTLGNRRADQAREGNQIAISRSADS